MTTTVERRSTKEDWWPVLVWTTRPYWRDYQTGNLKSTETRTKTEPLVVRSCCGEGNMWQRFSIRAACNQACAISSPCDPKHPVIGWLGVTVAGH